MRIDFVYRLGRMPQFIVLLAAISMAGGLHASQAYAADLPASASDTSAGYKAPGYPDYHLGQALVQRGDMKVRLHSRIEMRAGLLAGEDNQLARGDLIEKMGFGIPRARFGLVGNFTKHVDFAIVTDLVGARLTDAWVGYHRFRFFKMWFGARTIPFSRSAILSSADAAMSERSRGSSAMAPFRQVGLTIGGDYDLLGLSWRVGAYNGFDRGLTFFSGIENASGLNGNQFHGISSVGRLQIQPMGKLGPSVHDIERGKFRLSLGGGGYYNDGGGVEGMGLSADLHIKVAGLHFLGEFIQDSASPKDRPTTSATIPATITRQAISAELGYVWNKLTFAARVELINPNVDVENNDDEMWVSASVGRNFVDNLLRMWLQYDHRTENAGAPYDNDSLLFKIMLRL